jgi:hypothetical protein
VSDPSEREVRLRCVEAAARNPTPHPEGYTAGILEAAEKWATWIFGGRPAAGTTLGLPKKEK